MLCEGVLSNERGGCEYFFDWLLSPSETGRCQQCRLKCCCACGLPRFLYVPHKSKVQQHGLAEDGDASKQTRRFGSIGYQGAQRAAGKTLDLFAFRRFWWPSVFEGDVAGAARAGGAAPFASRRTTVRYATVRTQTESGGVPTNGC